MPIMVLNSKTVLIYIHSGSALTKPLLSYTSASERRTKT